MQGRFNHIFWVAIIGLFIWTRCKEPVEVLVPKGDDGQVFAIDTQESKIPYIVIDTRGASIPYEPGVAAQMKIYQEKRLVQTQRIDIEYRGKTSFRLSDKKAFNFETIDDAGEGMDVSLLGLSEEEDWRLIGHVVNVSEKYIWDRSLMYNHVAYELSNRIGKYASRGKFVEIEVNGEYMGVYYLCEKVKRDSQRIDIKSLNASSTNLTGGYILKIDKADAGPEHDGAPLSYFLNNWNDDARYTAQNSFRSQFDINSNVITFPPFAPPYHANQYLETYFMYEYPKAEDITDAQKTYIANYLQEFETALIQDDFGAGQRTYAEYIEIGSFVDYFIINELGRNVDAYRISTFLVKDRDGKLAMGPVWDFNIGFDEGGRIPMDGWVIHYNYFVDKDPWMLPFWWTRLMEDPVFRQAVKTRWTSLRSGPLSNANLQNLVAETAKYLEDNKAVSRNYAKWEVNNNRTYEQSILDLQNFLSQRANWMDGRIGAF